MLTRGESSIVHEVMLIDDEPIDLFINEKLLSSQGFATKYCQFPDAYFALRELEERITGGKPLPQVVFLDYFMPQIDGLDFLTRLKTMEEVRPGVFNDMRVIMLTSLRAPEKRKSLEEFDSIFRIMNKPLSEKSIRDLMASLTQQVI